MIKKAGSEFSGSKLYNPRIEGGPVASKDLFLRTFFFFKYYLYLHYIDYRYYLYVFILFYTYLKYVLKIENENYNFTNFKIFSSFQR